MTPADEAWCPEDQRTLLWGHKALAAPASPKAAPASPASLPLAAVCLLLCAQTAVLGVAAAVWSGVELAGPGGGDNVELYDEVSRLYQDVRWLQKDNANLQSWLRNRPANDHGSHPYEAITALVGHKQPEMTGRVSEKTIWQYWFHKESCTSSRNCTLPPHLQLCVESVKKNKGSFDYKLLHIDDVERYVSMYDLPFKWPKYSPQHQKDSLMNAVLARYGGVILDISTILLRPLDDYWEEMVAKGATFRGYAYRINGLPWRHPETSAVWFLMSRREGLFGTAVRNQVEGCGDKNTTYRVYPESYFALGDQTLLPILSMFNYSLPKCFDDPTVTLRHLCPEHEGPPWYKGTTGPARNDMTIMLRDPRDGPQLPFAALKSSLWNITNSTKGLPHGNKRFPPVHDRGGPMYLENCSSFQECWQDVFLRRFHQPPARGEARLLSFVKLFMHGVELEGYTRSELLGNRDTFFFNWLKLAGVLD